MLQQRARCDVLQKAWTPPPKPASCEFDWGSGLTLDAGKVHVNCVSDVVAMPDSAVLGYGTAIRLGTMVCASLTTGVRCQDLGTGHGFLLARERYSIF